jgi:type VI protein secretion system component VasK
MNRPSVMLAQLDGLNPLNPTAPVGRTTGLLFKDVMVIVATGLILALLLILWARYYVRRRKRSRRSPHHDRAADSALTPSVPLAGEELHHRRRRRKRRRRRDHRSRNPTLAETGGLPPGKPEGPSARSL